MGPLRPIFRPEALADTDWEAGFYAQKDDDGRLVGRFLKAVDEAVGKAAANPQTWPRVYRQFRRVHLRRFPFSVYYLAHRDWVEVFGVVHAKRDLTLLRERSR